jgi:formimidoylglutamate deiminase
MPEARRFFASQAWVDGAWAKDVLLVADAQGCWSEVRAGCSEAERPSCTAAGGAVLPGIVNAHSHAFQRAMAGLAEATEGGADDFWSWRERMYAVAQRITPSQLEVVAAQLYGELLRAGYTQVCEFHYLHNDVDGRPYADPPEMALALVRAAQRAGIGLTLLPTLYTRPGFGARGLRDEQRRFASTPESVLRIAEAVRAQANPLVNAGVALHSLRGVDEGALRELAQAARAAGLPVHIHVAEQQREVDECVAQHGVRPIEWLLQHADVDARWNLVHATHAAVEELEGVRAAGASIVLCPSTEANLGDGVFDLQSWLALGGRWSIGSDSHVTRDWAEELRLLEYMQRVVLRQRNVAAQAAGARSTAGVLFQQALAGGSAASGLRNGGLSIGERADFMVLDAQAPALAGVPAERMLDAHVFSSPGELPKRTFVAAREIAPHDVSADFAKVMEQLW